jgi:hypothetical protein
VWFLLDTHSTERSNAMKSFLKRHASRVFGVLRGFDRIRFRGTFRQLATVSGMTTMLSFSKVLFKDFGSFAEQATQRFREGVQAVAAQVGRPIRHVLRAEVDKEKLVDGIEKEQGAGRGGVLAILSATEVCNSFDLHRNREQKILELRPARRKCLHYYVYFQDPTFGRAQVRLQTWLPWNIHVVINGREWLARQMDADGLSYQRRDNCFAWVEDFKRAQDLFDRQLRIDWVSHLTRLLDQANPVWRGLLAPWELEPYWSAEQSEWATDIAFRTGGDLRRLYPRLVHHAMRTFGSQEVMRFLGRNFSRQPYINGHFKGEVISDVAARPEGIRVKHRVKGNAIKMYDKQGSVLRVETTINDARDLKSYRPAEGDPEGPRSYRPLRKGVADLVRRAELCDAANRRYLDALSATEVATPLKNLVGTLCHPVQYNGRRHRALNPFQEEDARLLATVARGEFLIKGFRNADIRTALCGADPQDPIERRRRGSRISRLLGLLRAHGLIKKIPHTHRYLLTAQGRSTIPAILAAHEASVNKLVEAA